MVRRQEGQALPWLDTVRTASQRSAHVVASSAFARVVGRPGGEANSRHAGRLNAARNTAASRRWRREARRRNPSWKQKASRRCYESQPIAISAPASLYAFGVPVDICREAAGGA